MRQAIYTTNIIESVNRLIRKNTKTKGRIQSVNYLSKITYLTLQDASIKWQRQVRNWFIIKKQLEIIFPNRLNNVKLIRFLSEKNPLNLKHKIMNTPTILYKENMFKLNIEDTLTQYNKILGIDEAGRDCCAGPLVVAGVVLPKNFKSDLINDSKKLSESKREKAYELIIQNAIEYKIEFASAEYVDEFNPKQATRNLMNKIVKEFNDIDLIITDFEPVTSTNIKQLNLIKGDSQSLNVAAASILAKVARD